ncbi:MAG: helix-turn-helix domain-containing protein [Clostridia bacterium]|nr:helix-turn-helix domain-containing protein [Clostridia bacterium]
MEPKLLTADRFVDPHTGCSYRYIYSDTEYFRPHFHDYYEIFVLLDGCAHHFINESDVILQKGTVVLIRPADTHDYLCVNGEPFSMLNFTFTQETAHALFDYLGDGFSSASLLGAKYPPSNLFSEKDFAWLNAQMTAIRVIPPTNTAALKTALRILLFRLLVKCFSDFSETGDRPDEMPAWLSDLCNEMRKSENFVYGIERMVELSGRSREHVARTLKRYTGQTLSAFINDMRLTFVANMLKNSNHSISHILFESGFNNVSWASELFRKKYGTTMRDFRNG